MPTTLYKDLNFLKNYFTSKEFDFISNATIGGQTLDYLIDKETKIRDTIVNLINNLEKNQENLEASQSTIDFVNEIQNIFAKINENLQLLNTLKNDFLAISERTIDLLIHIESSNENSSSYNSQIKEIRNMINMYSLENEKLQEQINNNNRLIDDFFKKDNVHKYLRIFNIEYTNELKHGKTLFSNIRSDNSFSDFPEENHVLRVSEKDNRVYLPYSKSELTLYMEQYSDSYASYADVIKKEFILPLDYYMKHPVVARFRETYSLIKDREAKSVMDALKYAFNLMFKYELNPIIIAACKTQEQLENYLEALEKNKLDEFKDFEIKFEVSLHKSKK